MIFELNEITVAEFYNLEEEQAEGYLQLSSLVNPKAEFLKKPAKALGTLQYGQVSIIKRSLLKPSLEGLIAVFEMVFGVSGYLQKRANIVEYFYALKWISEEIAAMLQKESKYLSGKPDPFLEMAGAARLSIFGELPALKMLGTQYGKSPEEVATWSYNLVFSLLYMDNIETDVRDNYNELKNRANKNSK